MGTAEYDRSAPVHDALTLPWDRQGEAHGPSWMPDPTFGHAGTAVTHFTDGPSDRAWAYDVALQPDAKVVVVGTLHYDVFSGGDSAAFAVARYRTGGTLDPDGALRLVE